MDEVRIGFVNAVLADEDNMTALCEEYEISRKTGYKWLNRFRAACLVLAGLIFAVRIAWWFATFFIPQVIAGIREAHLKQQWIAGRPERIRQAERLRRAPAIGLKRSWRILRHPIRWRAFIAESFRALKHPTTHKWSDGLS
jgi:putative transposase